MRIIKFIKNLFVNRGYVVALLLSVLVIVSDLFFNYIEYNGDLLSLSLTLIGFLVTVVSIFLTLPEDNRYIKRLAKYKKNKQFFILIWLSIAFLSISSITSLIKDTCKISLYSFIIAFTQLLWVLYNLYRIITGYNKSKKDSNILIG